jgi:hypothetical protein
VLHSKEKTFETFLEILNNKKHFLGQYYKITLTAPRLRPSPSNIRLGWRETNAQAYYGTESIETLENFTLKATTVIIQYFVGDKLKIVTLIFGGNR